MRTHSLSDDYKMIFGIMAAPQFKFDSFPIIVGLCEGQVFIEDIRNSGIKAKFPN